MTFYADQRSSWIAALRWLMDYPCFGTVKHGITFTGSTVGAGHDRRIADFAASIDRDVIDVGFGAAAGSVPRFISLVARGAVPAMRAHRAMLYAESETAPIDILAAGRRWSVGLGATLTSTELPPLIEWERGQELAWRCWRHVVETMEPIMVEDPLLPRRAVLDQPTIRPRREPSAPDPISPSRQPRPAPPSRP